MEDVIKELLKLDPDEREEIVEFLSVWEEKFDSWKRPAEIKEKLQKKYGEKRWNERRVFRWLKRLEEKGILIKKEGEKATFYRPSPANLGKFIGIREILYLEKILRNLKDGLGVYSKCFPRASFIWGSMGRVRGEWLNLPLSPFWEYNIGLSIFGFPENDLLPAEKAILEHITSKLVEYFKWLAWLRVKYLARKLFNIQLSLEDDIRRVLIEKTIEEGYNKSKVVKRIQKLKFNELTREIEKFFGKIEISQEDNADVNIWALLRELRNRGHANDLAVILTSGPTKVAITEKGIGLNVDDGIPLPPLNFPDKEESKRADRIFIQITDKTTPPSMHLENPLPFKVRPEISVYGYKYELEKVEDQRTIQKLKEGKLPCVWVSVYRLDELLKEIKKS